MSLRRPDRRYGRVTVTQQQLRKSKSGYGANAIPSYPDQRQMQVFNFTTSDFVVDGSRYKLTCYHTAGSREYMFQMHEQDDSGPILADDFWKGPTELILWFTSNSKNITVLIW